MTSSVRDVYSMLTLINVNTGLHPITIEQRYCYEYPHG
jgi:hypothetical protein